VSDRELAAELGVSHTAVQRARQRGLTATDPEEAKKQWAEITRPRSDGPVGAGTDDRSANARKNLASAEWTELKVREKKKDLWPRSEAMAAVSSAVSLVTQAVITFPDEKADAMAAELGIDPGTLRRVLKRHLYGHMEDSGKTIAAMEEGEKEAA
jgi:methylphosphotriester-DNA--protein-cysteine methyltransferase